MNSQSAWYLSICSESCLSPYLSASTVTNHYTYAIFYGLLIHATEYLRFAYFWVIFFIRFLLPIRLFIVIIIFKEGVVKIHIPFSIPYSICNVTFLSSRSRNTCVVEQAFPVICVVSSARGSYCSLQRA